jgi:ankyrin repeat protein
MREADEKLLKAAREGDADAILTLVQRGADVDARGNLGDTPLSIAVERWDESVASLLVELGADPNLSPGGRTLLLKYVDFLSCCLPPRRDAAGDEQHLSVRRRTLERIELLVELGTEMDAEASSGRKSALKLAVEERLADVAAVLLAAGASAEGCFAANLFENEDEMGGFLAEVLENLSKRHADGLLDVKAALRLSELLCRHVRGYPKAEKALENFRFETEVVPAATASDEAGYESDIPMM